MDQSSIMDIYSFLFGLVLGSFMNVCIYRVPLNQSIVNPPSACPKCGQKIKFYDNIPLLSYLILRGKCRNCRHPIPFRYPFVEALTGLLSLAIFIRYGLTYQYFLLLIFACTLVIISFIDLQHKIIPDIFSLPGVVIGWAASTLGFFDLHYKILPKAFSLNESTAQAGYFFIGQISWLDSLIGILAGGGSLFIVAFLYERLTGKEGMGGGDIKLLAMIGAWLGWRSLPFVLLTSSLTGLILGGGVPFALRKRHESSDSFRTVPLSRRPLVFLFRPPNVQLVFPNVFVGRR